METKTIIMGVVAALLLYGAIAVGIVFLVKSIKKNNALKKTGLLAKRKKDFYKYGYFFQLKNADFARVGNAMMQVRSLNLAELLSVPANPNVLVLRDAKNGLWEAQIELLLYNQGEYIYYFRFTKTHSTNGSLNGQKEMNACLTMFENVMYQCDPNVIRSEKELNIEKNRKMRIRVRIH